jgi:PPOX class probable FMN-dependent enzyme
VSAFRNVVATEAELRELVPPPPPERLSASKQLDALDEHARDWIDRTPLVLVATADAAGRCDVSPRGGPPGWVGVLDERRLVLPDAPGNRRVDSFRNVLANPRCGLLFVIPGRRDTLRVNGRACVTTDPELLRGIPGRPSLALGVEIEEVYAHCGKALIRSAAWDPEAWPDTEGLASLALMLRDAAARNGHKASLADAEAQIDESIRERLW